MKNTQKQTPEFAARVALAFEGKDPRQIIHAIKKGFPLLRMGDLNTKVILLKGGELADDEILNAVEAL